MSGLKLADYPDNRAVVWTFNCGRGLAVNTRHITRNDCLMLENSDGAAGLHIYPEGFILTFPWFKLTPDYSQAFHSLVDTVRQRKGVDTLRLDEVGTVFDDLPTFNW